MQIGNNRYTNSKKKAYRKPVMEVVEIDRVILLEAGLSGTEEGGTPVDPDNPTTVQGFSETNNIIINQEPSKKSNPFGGGTPDYER